MKTTITTLLCYLLVSYSSFCLAEMELIAPDGKRILLKDDMTWEYVEVLKSKDQLERYAHLNVVRVENTAGSCRIGFRLRNGLAVEIGSLVLRFSAYTEDDIIYETINRGFQHIKPTRQQYKEIMFRGLKCKEIKSLRVHGGDHCSSGDLTKYSAKEGECLEKVYVEASDKISIYKRYSDELEPEIEEAVNKEDVSDDEKPLEEAEVISE